MRFRLRRIHSKIRRRTQRLSVDTLQAPLLFLALIFLVFVFSSYRFVFSESPLEHALARSLLRLGMPSVTQEKQGGEGHFDLRSFIFFLTNYDLQDPLTMLRAVFPFSRGEPEQLRVWEERPFVFIQELSFAPDPIRPSTPQTAAPGRSSGELSSFQVLIYHTHTSEMYLGRAVAAAQSAQAHYNFRSSADPTITGVMAVGRHLTNALNSLGIATMHETKIHTLPNINHSYANSERTVRDILSTQQDLRLVLDLHRDAGVPNPSIVIDERSVARLVLVVGTAESIPLAHPNFRQNLEIAQKIKNICDQMYPGLMRPIQIQKEARYNQHLHPHSLIVELGSVENTLEEALLAAELLAKVLVRVL